MKRVAVIIILALLHSVAIAGIVKPLAKDRMADLDKLVATDRKILSEMLSPDANQTMLTRDQNVRYLRLIESSTSTFGDDPLSPQGACVKALTAGHEVWQGKVAYQKSGSNFDKGNLATWQKIYASERKECDIFIRNLH